MEKEDPVAAALAKFLPLLAEGPIGVEEIELADSRGRIAAEEIKAPVDSPPYSRSIIEGYLVDAADGAGASESSPVRLPITGEIPVGASDAGGAGRGKAIRVTTGSFVPPGEFGVGRLWDVKVEGNQAILTKPVHAKDNIEAQGCDRKAGSVILPKGKRIVAEDIFVLASHGTAAVHVARRPKVALFSSGDEVIPVGEELVIGKIWDCNRPGLSALIEEAGGEPEFFGIMRDDFDGFLAALKRAMAVCDMAVVSGGTAVGGRDFIAELFSAGSPPGTVVNGVPMRSGKPIVLAVWGKKPLIGVAGHPPEAARGFSLFARPALARLLGEAVV